jgi:hypothetical protein
MLHLDLPEMVSKQRIDISSLGQPVLFRFQSHCTGIQRANASCSTCILVFMVSFFVLR